MADVVPFNLPARQAYQAERRAHHQRIRIQRACKFRVEVPFVLEALRWEPEAFGEAIWEYVCEFARSKGAANVIPDLRCTFIGGLDAARARDQAWFTDYLSPGMILICFEANV